MDVSVGSLLKTCDAAFRADMLAYRNAQRELQKGIRVSKHRYKQRTEVHFENNNPCSMWRGIKTITDYNSSTSQIIQDATLPDALNQFFACFNSHNTRARACITPQTEEEHIPSPR